MSRDLTQGLEVHSNKKVVQVMILSTGKSSVVSGLSQVRSRLLRLTVFILTPPVAPSFILYPFLKCFVFSVKFHCKFESFLYKNKKPEVTLCSF